MAHALPRVDALLPAWQAERFIARTLEALAAQTYPNLHILISDDASPDRTASVCEAFAARTPRTRVMRQQRNLGWIGNSNALLAAAGGQYHFFALHDDVPHPRYVERMVETIGANPGAVAAFSDLENVLRRRGSVNQRFDELEGVTDAYQRARSLVTREGRWWIVFRALVRADAARQLGGLRRHWGGDFCSDFLWVLGLAMQGEFVRVPEVLMTRCQLADSVSARWRYSTRERLGLLLGCLEELRRGPFSRLQQLQLQSIAVTAAGRRAVLSALPAARRR